MKSPDTAKDITDRLTTGFGPDSERPKPVVSIYTICYNQEKYIRDTLEGILLQQTDFPIEAIVIDDASTDSTPDIIREYARKRPDIFRPVLLKENYYRQRRSKFFEIFLPAARGEFVAFCEGDDYWTYPLKLQRQVDFLRRHPGYSACFHLYEVKNETDIHFPTPVPRIIRSRKCGVKEILAEPIVQTASTLARIDSLRTDEEFIKDAADRTKHILDVRIYLSLLASGKVYVFKRYWSVYRLNKSGISYPWKKSYSEKGGDYDDVHLKICREFSLKYGGRFRDLPRQYLAAQRRNAEINAAIEKISEAAHSRKLWKGIWPLIGISVKMPKLTYLHAITIYKNHHAKK